MPDEIIRNEYGEVVMMRTPPGELPAAEEAADAFAGGETPTQIANRYLEENLGAMGLGTSRLGDADEPALEALAADGPMVVFKREKNVAGATVVVYDQTVIGLPIFDARIGVHIDASQRAVTSAQSSMHAKVEVANPEQKNDQAAGKKLSNPELRKLLGIKLYGMKKGRIQRQVVYRFEPEGREEIIDDPHRGCFGPEESQEALLPDLPARFKKGEHYILNEVLFEASREKGEPEVNWRALVEPESGEVLYLRALVASATAMVYLKDPQTQTGAAVNGADTNAVLNPFRTSTTLPGLAPATPQPLSGEYVELAETSAPVILPPEGAAGPASAFDFPVRDDDFSAVNAYYHCDKMFRTMADFGFDVAAYFGGTTFPVPVDFRALGNSVNAQAPGNATGTGLGELRFALLMPGEPVGMATSNRVTWHEFGHALLWDHVNSPNFGFAHSAGDALAAIFNDPGSNAPDRFDTFPWVKAGLPGLSRRHDRTIGAGWAWFGPQYNTQYQGEQVLSTTLFRLYRSLGGDSSSLGTQRRASETVAYLIFKAIGLLTATTRHPEVLVTNLQTADLTTASFKGIPGGALHKVVRWAFEKQGLFQPAAQPGQGNTVNSEGNPPDVDVYIDDGRTGEYGYLANHWSCQDLWVRHAADGGLVHQQPIVGQTNYMYVRVKNRGLQTAWGVNVSAYHCLPGTGLSFPDDWTPMDTANLPGANIPPGGETIVGPFDFVPTQVGHECLLAIAQAGGDPGNDTTITGTIPEYRFVPFDNNIGQRNVHPVPPTPGGLRRFLRRHPIWVRNPLPETAVCRLKFELPEFLERSGWKLRVVSEGGARFELRPRRRRRVVLRLEAGERFGAEDVRRAIAQGDHEIQVRTYLGRELSGGMTYPLSFDAEEAREPGTEGRPEAAEAGGATAVEQVLGMLGGRSSVLSDGDLARRIRTVRLELDLADD